VLERELEDKCEGEEYLEEERSVTVRSVWVRRGALVFGKGDEC
jgi:hypothetical protein